MDLKIIDNFLSDNDFYLLKRNTIEIQDGPQIPFEIVLMLILLHSKLRIIGLGI